MEGNRLRKDFKLFVDWLALSPNQSLQFETHFKMMVIMKSTQESFQLMAMNISIQIVIFLEAEFKIQVIQIIFTTTHKF